jgi:alkaline phosphatase D
MTWPRRLFLLNAARLVGASTAASSSLLLAKPSNAAGYPFSLGVASGSPLPDSVILWTRIAPDPLDATRTPPLALTLRWEVAHDGAFRKIAAKGTALATPELAHSVRVDVRGLEPGRWYWYRFMLGDAVSPVGRTRTAPAPDSMPDSLKLAVASCQHWEFGSYAASRARLLEALQSSRASNPLVLSGDVHTFYAAELARDATRPPSSDNPLVATEFCGTSVTSSSRPQARTEQYVAMNPHIKFGRSDRRGFMLLDITAERSTVLFQGLENVREKDSGIETLASFEVAGGRPGVIRSGA